MIMSGETAAGWLLLQKREKASKESNRSRLDLQKNELETEERIS